ncbi:MAG: S8 family serine peptidase [Clostridiales bacterium]|nr:S8 family serine peptidase [Clostridiales bacterium]
MKYLLKGFTALFTALALLLLSGAVFASPEQDGKNGEERITVIVEVEGDAVLEAKNAKRLGAKEFLKTSEAEKLEKKARAVQSSVQSAAESVFGEETDVIFTYTHVFNGFAMKTERDKIDLLRALPNVKNVYTDDVLALSEEEPEEDANASFSESSGGTDDHYVIYGSEMMNLPYMHNLGYTGKGVVIAIIDGAFDVSQIMFSGSVSNPRLSKNDIAEKIKNESFSVSALGAVGLSAGRVYRSEKIPYAFNYATLNSDTYYSVNDHGTHVAGIAAGNNGVDFEGKRFVGAAPDAQLLLMACAFLNSNGVSRSSALAAMEDAVKLGADVINESVNSKNNVSNGPEIKALNTARNAGIAVSISSSNNSRGYENKPLLAEYIDYSTLSKCADISSVTAVASIGNSVQIMSVPCFLVGGNKVRYADWTKKTIKSVCGTGTEIEYVYVNNARMSDFENVDVEGKIAVSDQFGIDFAEKAANAQASGALGLFIIIKSDVDVSNYIDYYMSFPVSIVEGSSENTVISAEEKKLVISDENASAWLQGYETKISSFNSWPTGNSLELKPEIMAVGEKVYSSLINDKFGTKSGTSMAAPFYAGASALMFEYMAANPDKYAPFGNRATLSENLLMSTAKVCMEDNEKAIPYSPRVQGAGLLDVEKAAKTPVFLLGDEFEYDGYVFRKAKISLREIALENGDTFNISFTAQNMTNEDVTYDKLDMTVITDSADENGVIGKMRKLSFTSDIPETVTVPALSEVDISFSVTLDKDELEENKKVFINGFYIDGYVFLHNTTDADVPDLNIPFAGFYGDWYGLPSLDGYYYDDDSFLKESFLSAETKTAITSGVSNSGTVISGRNLFDEKNDGLAGKEYAGFSPNYDGEADNVTAWIMPLRMLGITDYAICGNDGSELLRKTDISDGEYFYTSKNSTSVLTFEQEDLKSLPDGDYLFRVYAGFLFREPYEQTDMLEMPFYIDREAPKIQEFSVNGNTLSLSLSDNRYLMGYIISGTSHGEPKSETFAIEHAKLCETTADISDYDGGSIKVEVFDYAYNHASVSEKPPKAVYSGRNGNDFAFRFDNGNEDTACTVIMAAYLDGRPVKITSRGDVIPRGESFKVFNFDPGVYDKIKLFIWDSLDGMTPICEQVEIG